MKFLCLDFINSRWYINHKPFKDPLTEPGWLTDFCNRWDLPKLTVSTYEMDQLTGFREFLFQVMMRLCTKQTISSSDMEKLNKVLKSGQSQKLLMQHDNHYRLLTVQQTDDITWIIYQVALSFAKLITKYPLAYLKKCENPKCDWIFYDDSKSHTRKWCDNRCASLMKVRKYRAARKTAQKPVDGQTKEAKQE